MLDMQIDLIKTSLDRLRSAVTEGGEEPAPAPAPAQKTAAKKTGRRPLSAAARKRISLAQKRRWADSARAAAAPPTVAMKKASKKGAGKQASA